VLDKSISKEHIHVYSVMFKLRKSALGVVYLLYYKGQSSCMLSLSICVGHLANLYAGELHKLIIVLMDNEVLCNFTRIWRLGVCGSCCGISTARFWGCILGTVL
jgi:hypothetical protein